MGVTIRYDPEADAIYASIRDGEWASNRIIDDLRIVDLDTAGEPIGVELLAVSHGIDWDGLPHADELRRAYEAFRALPAA